ncbi:methylmalonyl-CoA mutase family protein [Streptomyces sp. JJ36]|uniref:methylmalonyl-CoA mutase family protein n=1 Tax=Streptomyces sp. JJ36 TaxID=2736645 RepID=UPI001F3EEB8B|nr:methylmalonyl-CoA mutase family protein [Streptomyces sp. JJ36]MCF6526053.1 methylmalonyl-CoA mutase small subunit [Streptomyces sp. JJ36]
MTVLPDDGLSLAAEFPEATRTQWQHLVAGVLRKTGATEATGAAAEEALSTTLEDGLATQPLYTAADGAPAGPAYPGFAPYTRGTTPTGHVPTGWDVRQLHARPEPERANEAVLADLENGVSSLWLAVGAHGLPVDGLETALAGVYLDLAPVVLDAGADTGPAAHELLRVLDAREVPRHAAAGNLGADPLGLLARTGEESGLPERTATAAELAALCDREYPGLRALTADALPYHEAGASPAQELGCALATAVAYVRELTAAGLPVDAACGQLEFRFAATADQFLTLAKLRAARRLWARVAQVCGASDGPGGPAAQRQHVVTSPVMYTRRDPWVNMLRATIASLGAGLGGADAVTVLPFDHALGLPDGFARRIARNTSTILIEESHLARVTDPAGGSWYVERLTDELAHAAWAWFQELERAGGQAAALRSGLVGERLAENWRRRSRRLAHRTEPITGVSEFPLLAEPPVERDPAPEPPSGGLPRVRRDEDYEALRARSDAALRARSDAALRARSDAALAADGARPRVFLAALGSPAAHTPRVTFAANLFQAGGIEPVHDPVTVDPESAGEAFAASGARIACLCSSDTLYAEQAEQVAAALKAAGARRVYLAGRPDEETRERYLRAGVDEFVFAGGDAVALLSSALDRMGVA